MEDNNSVSIEVAYERAKEFAKTQDYICASRLQANLCMGYPRAKKIISMLVEEGVVEQVEEYKYNVIK